MTTDAAARAYIERAKDLSVSLMTLIPYDMRDAATRDLEEIIRLACLAHADMVKEACTSPAPQSPSPDDCSPENRST